MNCMYWEYRFPRLITNKQMQNLLEKNNSRLIAIGDISCDPGVSSKMNFPFFFYVMLKVLFKKKGLC